MQSTNPLIVILYDSVMNSVFAGQVLKPLILHEAPLRSVIIITFERHGLEQKYHTLISQAHSNIQLVVCKKLPYIGTCNLFYAYHQIKKIISLYPSYEIRARGPFAGYIAQFFVSAPACEKITIQARGLAAQEYIFTLSKRSLLHSLRAYFLHKLEQTVYTFQHPKISVEAVSPALKEYLVQTFKTPEQQISLAQHDIPEILSETSITQWRTEVREKLGIQKNTYIYCYNGSAKAWQCPRETVQYFKNNMQRNAFLLILTQDSAAFKKLLQEEEIPDNLYALISVPHEKVYHYLAACDAGILLREEHIVNWTSRPTKMLEYQAAGLTIVHNNTVAWLAKPSL